MNRADFQKLARLRLREARALRDGGLNAGAYYLSGYVVECALKACIARSTNRYDFPDRSRTNAAWSHDLNQLLGLAGLEPALKAAAQKDKALGDHWAVVANWSERSRYDRTIDAQQAADLYKAVADPKTGVLKWLRAHW